MAKPIKVTHCKSFEEAKAHVGPHEGVKAAIWLIEILETHMKNQTIVVPTPWIDFEHETEIQRLQFSPAGYVEFAKKTCADVAVWTKRAYEEQLREDREGGGPDIHLPPSR